MKIVRGNNTYYFENNKQGSLPVKFTSDGLDLIFDDGSKVFFVLALHNDEGPAIEYRDNNGNIIAREYRLHGMLHRTTGPALEGLFVSHRKNPVVLEQWWYKDNVCVGIKNQKDFNRWLEKFIQNEKQSIN